MLTELYDVKPENHAKVRDKKKTGYFESIVSSGFQCELTRNDLYVNLEIS